MIQLFFGVLFAFISALYDKGKRFTNHTPRFLFRIAVTLIIAKIGEHDIHDWIINVIIIGVGFYLVFDYFLNILEKRKWNYIGNTAKLDKFVNKYVGWMGILVIKVLLLFVLICLKD